MLGLLKPKPPLEILEKVWTERRMHWLAQRFGLDRMKSATVVLPTTDFFPNTYDAQPDAVSDVFSRVCGFMQTNPDRFDLRIKSCCQGGTCGKIKSDGEPVIELSAEDVEDQERLIATFSRAVARDELVRSGHVDPAEGDFDSLTDLLPVFSGMGIFQANTSIKSKAETNGSWEYWSIRGAGFLQSRVPGYAMALMAWIRGEPSPHWASMLGADAAGAFHKGYKYVTKTGDSLFTPDNASQPSETDSSTAIADAIRRGTDTQKVGAMWKIRDNPSLASDAIGAIADCLRHRESGVAIEAARVLVEVGQPAESALPDLVEKLSAPQAMLRAHCAAAIGAIKPALDACPGGLRVEEELIPLLQDRNAVVVDAAMRTLASYGKDAEEAIGSVVPKIVHYARDCEFTLLTSAVAQVAKVVDDPQAFFVERLEKTDPELRDRILEELAAQQAEAEPEA